MDIPALALRAWGARHEEKLGAGGSVRHSMSLGGGNVTGGEDRTLR